MGDTEAIARVFASVLYEDMKLYHVSHNDIRVGIQNMKQVYLPGTNSLSSEFLDVANYNDVAHRCAYIHKYAPFHTALVRDMFAQAMFLQPIKSAIQEFFLNSGRIELCSLGGGPGSDILGVISVLVQEFGFFQISATIIDYMGEWRNTFHSVIRELRDGTYGGLGDIVQPQYFHWNYIGHNLLDKMSNDVNKAIQGAHLVTMVKFVSAAACKDASEMLKKIFRSLKPGALVLYIDNAGGGFHQIANRCAQECNLFTAFGPLKHQPYTNTSFNVKKFGYTPCLETKVTFHLWKKSKVGESNQGYIPECESRAGIHTINANTTHNTLNQYTLINANMYYSDPPQAPQRGGQGRSNRSRRNVPIVQQPRQAYTRTARDQNAAYVYEEENENYDEESDEFNRPDDCGCCVIS